DEPGLQPERLRLALAERLPPPAFRAVLATALRRGEVVATPSLAFRDARTPLVAQRRVRLVVRRGERPRVRLVGVPDELTGPLDAGERVGTAVVSRHGDVVARVPVVTREDVPAPSIGDRLSSALPSLWLIGGLAVLAACSLLFALRLRRRTRRRRARGERAGGTEAA
ncbi:MAG TPA: DNA/RNA-binding winged helix domain-containing protein, partial [Capillimicrobium sp.]|nr:DNA/RNA-binding winged helix domain-containing protein [Capillimicrobium sp.]